MRIETIGNATLYLGDCSDVLRGMPAQSVNCCVTSPPYFGLRDYGNDAQIGLEQTPDEYVTKLVEVFREVRRVLRDDGTLWLNLGDSYAAARGGTHMPAQTVAGGKNGHGNEAAFRGMGGEKRGSAHRNALAIGLKHKDLIGIPWRVAFALQADGWYLRQDIIWAKPNPMPESVTDRCTKSHEYLFLLSKSPRYYFDHEAIKEPAVGGKPGNTKPTKGGRAYEDGHTEHRTAVNLHKMGAVEFRNRRDVWNVATKPYKGAHFATFPPDLIEPCVLAGCPVGGTVLDPFGGAGTTGLVAQSLGRNSILIELNPEYIEIAKRRIDGVQQQGRLIA